jgi:RimJ/RimL family protein N-acetyltransferase
MLPPALSVRLAVPADAPRVFPWRNAEATRRFFHDSGPLTLDGHIAWFHQALADPDRVLLIGESATAPIGVLRYDLSESTAMVSVYLDPALRGRGYGTALLLAGERWLRDQRESVAALRAEIRAGNTASHAAFARAGFVERSTVVEKLLQPSHGSSQ